MRSRWIKKGRVLQPGFRWRGTLLLRPYAVSLLACLTLRITPAFLLPSCVPYPAGETASDEIPPFEVLAPEYSTSITLEAGEWAASIRKLDILIYSLEGTGDLEQHLVFDGFRENVEILSGSGSRKVVVVANSPCSLEGKAVDRFSAAGQLSFAFSDENPDFPALTGSAGFSAGNQVYLALKPFLCTITIDSVSNAMDGYILAERPSVHLESLNPSVLALQEDSFRPSEIIETGATVPLPCDIGFYTQHPGTVLHCYPDDSPDSLLGSRRPVLVFECDIEGEHYRAEETLPPMGRSASVKTEIRIGTDRHISISYF